MPKTQSIEDLLLDELKDLYDAEKQLVRALPKLAKAASYPELQEAFREHLEVTKGQVARLEQVFETLEQKAKSKPCKAMKGLIEEGQEVMQEDYEETLLDVALITAGQKVEHYEIAGYGNARTLAQAIGRKDVAELLQETLNEEGEADKKLTAITKKMMKEHMAEMKRGGGSSEPEERSSRSSSGKRAQSPASNGGGRAAAGKSSKSARGRNGNGNSRAASHALTDHEEIRQWAEQRGAQPACVRGTGNKGDIGMIRLDFPGYSGETSLEQIKWDEWFEKFDENGLALLVQDTTARGAKSNFNKLVSRETAEA